MLNARHIAISTALVLAGLALTTPASAAASNSKTQSYNRCIEHYTLEWREWAQDSRQQKIEQIEAQERAAQERADAWNKLATSPGIPSDLAISYRKKADDLRATSTDHTDALAPVSIDQKELADFCNEVVGVLIAPAPAAAPKKQAANVSSGKKVRVATKPRRIKRARTVQRRTRPRISLGIGFVGIGF